MSLKEFGQTGIEHGEMRGQERIEVVGSEPKVLVSTTPPLIGRSSSHTLQIVEPHTDLSNSSVLADWTVFEVADLPAQERLVKRDDELPCPQCRVVARTLGRVVLDEQRG